MASATSNSFTPGMSYSFKLLTNSVLSNTFENVKVLSLAEVSEVPTDVFALHNVFYPHMNSVADTPSAYNYIRVKHPNGDTEYVGVPWVDGDSLFVVTEVLLNVTIRGHNPNSQALLSKVLADNGFGDNVITITSSN